MQPSEQLTADQRIAEVEEAQMLFLAIIANEPADASMETLQQMKARLAYLMERMRDRMNARILREGPYQAPPERGPREGCGS